MAVATAIVGGAVVGAVGSSIAADKAGKAATRGATSAADAQLEGTRLQVEELRRQFDAQMELLGPLMETQYGANSAFAELLGFSGYDSETGQFSNGYQVSRNEDGSFRDPNLSSQQLGADNFRDTGFGRQVSENALAAPEFQDDLAFQRVNENRLAAPSLAQDERFGFAQDTQVVGDTFQEGPGYQYAVEQGQKAVDRRLQRGGGNYGGRALLEAQRRGIGEANQEYYNYVRARQTDLGRQDQAAAAFQDRERYDVARGDAATENYLQRQQIDVTRGDQAALNNQQLQEFDLRRSDQAYYNYLAQLGGAGGVNANSVGQAVSASGATAGGVASAYGQQGGNLASIYNTLGQNQANIGASNAANITNAITGAGQNYLTYNALKPNIPPQALPGVNYMAPGVAV